MMLWLRKPLCWLSMCPFRAGNDDTGCWGECVHCGKRVGFLSRAELRAYADREWEAHQARAALTREAGK